MLGELDRLVTVSDFIVSSFVGLIPYPYPFHPSPLEVAELIEVPISFLLDKRHRRVETMPLGTQAYFYHYQKYVIWGITARILSPFLEMIAAEVSRAQ